MYMCSYIHMARIFFREPVSRSGFIPGFKVVSCPLAAPAVSCPVSCLVSCPVSCPLFGPRFQGWFHRSLLSPGFQGRFHGRFQPRFQGGFHGWRHCLVACAAFVSFAALAGLRMFGIAVLRLPSSRVVSFYRSAKCLFACLLVAMGLLQQSAVAG